MPDRDPRLFDYSDTDKTPKSEGPSASSISTDALYQLLNGVDWVQTRQISRSKGDQWKNADGSITTKQPYNESESSWLIGKHPSKDKVDALFLSKALAGILSTKYLPAGLNNIIHAIAIMDTGNAVKNNYNLGIKANF